MLQSRVCRQDRVVGLNDRIRHFRGRVDTEFQFGLLAVVGRKALKKESTETRPGTTTEGVEHKEALEARAVICKSANLIHDEVNLLLADGIVTASIYEGGSDELVRM